MARMYSKKKGRSGSKKPPVRIVPEWLKIKKEEIEKVVIGLAKKGYTSAQIGTILRDQYGIPDVRVITGKKITQIMKENDVYPKFPEDLMSLFKKAVNLYEHLKKHKSDKHSKRGYQLLESKIRRLIKYYQRKKRIPKDFKFDIEKVKLIVERR
ncbi:MAG: 30S ribosomal protein S15 [Candidatus Aenigmarchaeota archaeon]|nr:30S ribosomal protein S15 [Candidatus Aenigmarchaeota archaeon]